MAIKTLKPGAVLKTVQDFVRESELMADLKHTNIVCLIGVCMQEEPKVHLYTGKNSIRVFNRPNRTWSFLDIFNTLIELKMIKQVLFNYCAHIAVFLLTKRHN